MDKSDYVDCWYTTQEYAKLFKK